MKTTSTLSYSIAALSLAGTFAMAAEPVIETLPLPAEFQKSDTVCMPAPVVLQGDLWLMTFARLRNNDCSSAYEYLLSTDGGISWSAPAPVAPLVPQKIDDYFELAVADVRCFENGDRSKALIIGCDDLYTPKGAACYDATPQPQLERGSYYTVFDAKSQTFGARGMLRNPKRNAAKYWRVAGGQAALAPDGDWILPAFFERDDLNTLRFGIETVKVHLEGDKIVPVAWGSALNFEYKRGIFEPSLIRRDCGYLMTIRAEDGKAYVTKSTDGLQWQDLVPWGFDDGTELVTDSTQQHWLAAHGKLYLVYTRNNGDNAHISRFRAPLYMAEVDETGDKPILKKATEIVLIERRQRNGKDGILGNFHVATHPDGSAIAADAYEFFKVQGYDITDLHTEAVIKRVR